MARPNNPADDAGPGAKRLAWAVVILLGCAFSYCLGWQSGWARGASSVDTRLQQYNDFLRGTRAAALPGDSAAASDDSDDSNDNA